MKATPTQALRTRPVRIGGLSLRLDPRTVTVVVLLLVCALAASVVLIGTGDFPIPAGDVLKTLFGGGNAGQEFIVNELRLPRVLVGLLVGASLGLGVRCSSPSPAIRWAVRMCSASRRGRRPGR